MNVLIVGAGAMGSLIGARLSKTDANVFLLDINVEHVATVRRHGLTIEELDGSKSLYPLSIFSGAEQISESIDLVVVMVKAYATRKALRSVLHLCHADTHFLTLQNGVGHWRAISELVPSERICVGTTAQGATFLAPGRIRHGGRGATYLGQLQGKCGPSGYKLTTLFNQAGLETFLTDEIESRIWQKLIVNVGINAITAITRIPNGWIAADEHAAALAQRAVREALTVAEQKGIELPVESAEQVFAIAQATAANRSSMHQDLSRKSPTEIDAINGAIVQYARELGLDTPVNWTLVQLIRIIERRQADEVRT